MKDSTGKVIYEPIKWKLYIGSASGSETDAIWYTVTGAVDGATTDNTGMTYADLIGVLNKLSDGTTTINPGVTQDLSYELSWEWPFEGVNDEYDTILGQIANGSTVTGYSASTTVTLDLKISVTQVQDTAA